MIGKPVKETPHLFFVRRLDGAKVDGQTVFPGLGKGEIKGIHGPGFNEAPLFRHASAQKDAHARRDALQDLIGGDEFFGDIEIHGLWVTIYPFQQAMSNALLMI